MVLSLEYVKEWMSSMKIKWFFPILRHYGFNHWYNHSDVGQVVQWIFVGSLIISVMIVVWFLMSVLIIADPSYGYYHPEVIQ